MRFRRECVGDGFADCERDPALGEEQALWCGESGGVCEEQEVLLELSRVDSKHQTCQNKQKQRKNNNNTLLASTNG